MKKLIFALSLSTLCSCNALTPPKSADENFIGQWKFYGDIPADKLNDHTQDGLISSLTRVENTNGTYSFAIYTGQTVTFTKLNDTTLRGEDNDMKLIYFSQNQHLALQINSTKGIEFSKLK